jgi:hypothetical protein
MINKKIRKNSILILAGIILFASYVSAFAVSCEFWNQNPLIMYPGETKEIPVILQNLAGTEDISAKGEILEGTEIAEFKGENDLLIPLGEKQTLILKVEIPEEVPVNTNYKLKLSFLTTSDEQAGNVGLASNIERDIPVIIKEKTPEIEKGITGKSIFETGPVAYIILVIMLALIIAIVVFIKKRKQKTSSKLSKKSR